MELIALLGEEAGEVLAYAQAMRHIESAGEALDTLYGSGRAHPRVHIGVRRPWPLADTLETLRAHFSFRSAIFRHALRVGLATAAGTAVAHLQLAHGIWVPMATLIVLQPEFGGTINRALQRTAGTVAGAALAGLMLATLNGTLVFEPLLIVLLFAAFFVLRRRYGLGVTFPTPIVVLILATADTSPWWDTLERIVDTILGAALGLEAGYLFWPRWERERLPRLAARALREGDPLHLHDHDAARVLHGRQPLPAVDLHHPDEVLGGDGVDLAALQPRIDEGADAHAGERAGLAGRDVAVEVRDHALRQVVGLDLALQC